MFFYLVSEEKKRLFFLGNIFSVAKKLIFLHFSWNKLQIISSFFLEKC